MLDATLIDSAATILATRRRTGEQGSRLPESLRPLDIDTALAIQAAVTQQLGLGIGGWKCALPAPGRVTVAPIYAGTIHSGGVVPVRTRAGRVRVEPELAFMFGRDLPARDTPYTPTEV